MVLEVENSTASAAVLQDMWTGCETVRERERGGERESEKGRGSEMVGESEGKRKTHRMWESRVARADGTRQRPDGVGSGGALLLPSRGFILQGDGGLVGQSLGRELGRGRALALHGGLGQCRS